MSTISDRSSAGALSAVASSVHLRGIHKRYGDTVAVQPLDLEVQAGEFLTLLGPSGCGKTTTLRMIAGFVSPSGGQLLIDGENVTALPPQKRRMGMVFQGYSLFPHLNIADNIAFGLIEHGVPRVQRDARVAELLDLIRLPAIGKRYPSEISGGQQQRVALARAVAYPPRVLLMDEPLGALDAKLREAMQQEIRAIQKALSITTIFVTHDQSEAMSMSDRIAVMNGGRIEQIDAPRTIYEKPHTRFVADFVGKINFLDAAIASSDGKAHVGELPIDLGHVSAKAKPGERVTIALRPERIGLRPGPLHDQPASTPGSLVWPATVQNVTFLGSLMHVTATLPGGQTITAETAPTSLAPGDMVCATFQQHDVLLMQDVLAA